MTASRTGPDPDVDPLGQLSGWLDQGQCQRILEWYREVSPGWLAENPEAVVVVATAAGRTGDYAMAGRLAAEASISLKLIGDHLNLFRAVSVLGGVAFEQGRLVEAWEHYRRAHAIALQLGDPTLIGRVTMNQASIRHLRGESWAATRLYEGARRCFEAADDRRGQAQVAQNLAIVAREDGRHEAAAVAANRAVDLAEAVGDPGLLGMALACRADVELASGLVDQGSDLDRARALATEAGDALGEVEVERLRAAWHLAQGQPEEAVEAAEIARNKAKRLGTLVSRSECAAIGAAAWEAANQTLLAEARRDEAELLNQLLGTKGIGRPRTG